MTHEQFRDAKGQAFLEDLDNYAVKLLGFSYMRPHSMRNNNQILHGGQTRCEENFTTSTLTLAKMTRMLTRDLFVSFLRTCMNLWVWPH